VGFAKFVPSAVVAFVSANCKSNQPAILTVPRRGASVSIQSVEGYEHRENSEAALKSKVAAILAHISVTMGASGSAASFFVARQLLQQ
jgi:hypothetical protein